MMAVVFGLLLSVVSVSISKSPSDNAKLKDSNCDLATVDSDCSPSGTHAICVASGFDAYDLACQNIMKKP